MKVCFVLGMLSLWFMVVEARAYAPSSGINLNYLTSVFSINPNGTYIMSDSEDANYNMQVGEKLFDHHVDLDEKTGIKLSWKFDEKNITFKLSGPSYVGWIGIGISRDGTTRAESDFMMLCLTAFGDFYLIDAHIEDNTFLEDNSQDVHKQFAFVSTSVEGVFTRPLVTCDQDDVEITKDTLRIFWAYGRTIIEKNRLLHPQINLAGKGQIDLKLLNPSTAEFDHTSMSPDFKTKDISIKADNVNVSLSKSRHCLAFRFAAIKDKIHITEFHPDIQKKHQFNVRQIIIKECLDVFPGLDSSDSNPVDCDAAVIEVQCTTTVLAWVPSMVTFAFPGNIGYPVTSSSSHFMMEIQYRQTSDEGFKDSSGMRIFYTETLRAHDVGVLTTGSLVYKSQLIPPRSRDFQLQGHCMAECIRLSISEDAPVHIFSATLHAREKGRKIRVRHFRDGHELAPVTADNTFRHEDYQTEYIPRNIQLQKGDNMIVECHYDSSKSGEITFVNNSQGGESCLAYLGYYPRNAKLTACETAPTENVIMATVGATRHDEMLKQAQIFAWTSEQTRVYNKRLLESQVYVQCGDIQFENPKPVPKIGKVYREEHKCYIPQSTPDREVDISTYASYTEFSTSGAPQYRLPMVTVPLLFCFCLLLHDLLLT